VWVPVIVRRARELLVASTTLSIAAAAHLFAGGALPATVVGWLVPVALSLPVSVWTARRRLTLPRLVPAMALLQVVQHTTLGFMATADAARGSGPHVVPTGAHAGHLLDAGALAPTLTDPAHAAHAGGATTDLLMLTAHAAAVLLTAAVLAAGDRAAAFLVVWLAAVVLLVTAAPRTVRARRATLPRSASWVPRTWWGLNGLRLRGPPAAAVHA
jgi:hypothetical protein